jgi:hypothetical protein
MQQQIKKKDKINKSDDHIFNSHSEKKSLNLNQNRNRSNEENIEKSV